MTYTTVIIHQHDKAISKDETEKLSNFLNTSPLFFETDSYGTSEKFVLIDGSPCYNYNFEFVIQYNHRQENRVFWQSKTAIVSFEYVLEKVPAEIQEKLLFHLDIFR